MTRDEAIKLINGQIYDCEQEICQDDPLVRGCRAGLIMALGIVKQIDEPPTPVGELHPNWTNWHKAEEEQPTETGDYLTAFIWRTALQLVPPTIEYRVCRYIKDYGWQEFGWKTLAWQKIEEYKEWT